MYKRHPRANVEGHSHRNQNQNHLKERKEEKDPQDNPPDHQSTEEHQGIDPSQDHEVPHRLLWRKEVLSQNRFQINLEDGGIQSYRSEALETPVKAFNPTLISIPSGKRKFFQEANGFSLVMMIVLAKFKIPALSSFKLIDDSVKIFINFFPFNQQLSLNG
jgi:hypothetical protein